MYRYTPNVRFVLDQHGNYIVTVELYNVSSLKQQSAGHSTLTHFPDSEPNRPDSRDPCRINLISPHQKSMYPTS